MVEDLRSANGILVNSRPCDTAVLKSGDVITVGLVNLIFSLDDENHDAPHEFDKDTARHLVAALTETQVLEEEVVEQVTKKPSRVRVR